MSEFIRRVRKALADRYEIEREIGRGGMAVVFLARDLQLGRQVAIKVIRPELTQAVGIERFLREIRIEAALDHPNIVALFDSGEADGFPFYVMPYVKGESLRQRLERENQLALDEVLRITRGVAEGLSYAHERGIVHKDIKPENILLSGDRVLIADFGIAKATADADGVTLSTYGIVLGTPEYMSPEQAMGDKVDLRTDIYALGCVVFEMLAGDPPFTGRTRSAVVAKHVNEHVPSLDVVRIDIPHGIAEAVETALRKVPADRFPTTLDFAAALNRGSDTAPFRPPVMRRKVASFARAHPILAAVALVAVVAISTPLVRSLLTTAEPRVHGRPHSLIVLPYHTVTTTENERDFVVELAGLITMELNNWESIRAVPRVSLAGPMFDLGVPGPTLEVIDDGIRLARDADVEALLALTVDIRQDTALVEALLYDAGTAHPVSGQPLQTRGPADEPMLLVGPIVQGILGLGNVPVDPRDLRRQTNNPEALQAQMRGQEYLARWRLAEAEQSFREAIALDSTFGMAYHHLAQTLYWQVAEQPSRATTLGPEISQVSNAAMRYSQGLSSRDSLHIHAFYAFQQGDYQSARDNYSALLSRDTTDVYAWLMLGSVEYRDPWLMELDDGSYLPRSNLNVASHAFLETVLLNPAFDLGYGHLFDIETGIARSAEIHSCFGYEMPRAARIMFWEQMVPHQMVSFCAWAADSITWMSKPSFDSLESDVLMRGATRLVERTLTMVRRWTEYAPSEPRPHEEMSEALLRQRSLPARAAPEVSDSIARLAMEYLSRALHVSNDTLPIRLVHLANLRLGAGNLDGALALMDSVVDMVSPEELPTSAVSVYMAAGQPARAMDLVTMPVRRIYIPDSLSSTLVPYGGAEPALDRARILASTGVGGAPLQRELDVMSRVWNQPQYTDRQRELLRRDAARNLTLALLFDPQTLLSWTQGVEIADPLWNAVRLSESDAERAAGFLDESLSADHRGLSEVTVLLLHGTVAARTGNRGLAVELYSRIDSIPLSLEGYSTGWGLRALSFMLRGDAYAALGETSLALHYYSRFVEVWANADSLTAHHVQRIRGEIERLRDANGGDA